MLFWGMLNLKCLKMTAIMEYQLTSIQIYNYPLR